jgi:AraC family transcriptional regulator of adaptative response / DNA-3-methyladenine glycosylase II
LPVRQPFDAPGVFRFLAVHAVEGVETADVSDEDRLRYARTLSLPAGPGAVELTASRTAPGVWEVRADLELSSLSDVATAVARVRRLLDLDADPLAVDAALAEDPALAPGVARTPGIRVPGTVDPHELLVRAVVGQQISVAAARTHLGRLARALGTPHASRFPGLTLLFPTASTIATGVPETGPDRPLRLPARSVRTVVGAARDLTSGELVVDVGIDVDVLRESLTARPGIGPWTAAYVAMRVLGDPDSWLTGDVALLAGARRASVVDPDLPGTHRRLAEHAARWAPWRSYAAMHLWTTDGRPQS